MVAHSTVIKAAWVWYPCWPVRWLRCLHGSQFVYSFWKPHCSKESGCVCCNTIVKCHSHYPSSRSSVSRWKTAGLIWAIICPKNCCLFTFPFIVLNCLRFRSWWMSLLEPGSPQLVCCLARLSNVVVLVTLFPRPSHYDPGPMSLVP